MMARLQKFLAEAGFGSRRQIEEWIRQGRLSVDGRPAELGQQVCGEERILLDGNPLRVPTVPVRRRVLAYYKPVGEVCSRSDPEGRPTVFERLPKLRNGRWVAVGRLDISTQGLMLFTNDGELANRLMHPSRGIEREYAVRVLGEVGEELLQRLVAGVELEDGPARFESLVRQGGEGANAWYHVTLCEGRNREVRRLWESQGVRVSRLIRVRYGPVGLRRGLRPGRWEELEVNELNALLESAGMAPRPVPAQGQRRPRRAAPPPDAAKRPTRRRPQPRGGRH